MIVVVTVRARQEVRAEPVAKGRARLSVRKKTNAAESFTAASASGTMKVGKAKGSQLFLL